MANLIPTPGYDEVPQIEINTPALGGPGQAANSQAQALLNRLEYIKALLSQTSGGGAVKNLYPNYTASIADNYSLSAQPPGIAEGTVSVVCNSGVDGGVTFIERFVSDPIGGTSIEGGLWRFNTYATVSADAGFSEIITRVNKRVEYSGITVAFTGTGPTRTVTATGGTPFIAGHANASMLLAALIETPTQTAWISGFISSSVVTVTLTDPAFVNVSGVALNAIYTLLFSESTGDLSGTTPNLYTTQSVHTSYAIGPTDRIVLAYFGKTDSGTNKTITFYHDGTTHFSFLETPLVLRHDELSGLNADGYLHLTVPEFANMATLSGVQTFTGTKVGAVTALSVVANAIAVDMALTNNFEVTLQATTGQTLSNPTNAVKGTSGQIAITQNATPSTLAFGANWISTDGTTPVVSTTAGAVNLITYYVVDSTHVWFALNKHGVA